MSIEELKCILDNVYSKDTAHRKWRAKWNKNNVTYGQCVPTALLVQYYFGGEIYVNTGKIIVIVLRYILPQGLKAMLSLRTVSGPEGSSTKFGSACAFCDMNASSWSVKARRFFVIMGEMFY